jgi:hypothetical protein
MNNAFINIPTKAQLFTTLDNLFLFAANSFRRKIIGILKPLLNNLAIFFAYFTSRISPTASTLYQIGAGCSTEIRPKVS